MTQLHYASIKSVYEYESSLFVNDAFVNKVIYVKQLAPAIWANHAGRTEPNEVVYPQVIEELNTKLKHMLNGFCQFNTRMYQTAREKESGFEHHIDIELLDGMGQRIWHFDIIANSPAFARMLKTIMETHATSVTGIELQYSVETATSVVGHDGQTIKVPTQVKRTEVNPTFTFPEVTGNLIWEVFNRWAFDLGDPDTNAFAASQATPNTFVSSAYSLSMAAIQFDASMLPQNIIGGAFYSNMFPTDPAGGFGLERTIGTSKTPERSVAFTGHIRHNWQTRQLLVQLATDLGLGRMRYTGGQAQAAPFADIMKGAGITNELDLLLKA
jgi:hypothetical protein